MSVTMTLSRKIVAHEGGNHSTLKLKISQVAQTCSWESLKTLSKAPFSDAGEETAHQLVAGRGSGT